MDRVPDHRDRYDVRCHGCVAFMIDGPVLAVIQLARAAGDPCVSEQLSRAAAHTRTQGRLLHITAAVWTAAMTQRGKRS